MIKLLALLFTTLFLFSSPLSASLTEEEMAALVVPPMELGTKDEALPVWHLLNGGGAPVGYIFETRDLAPIPGFSGTPMNLLVAIDLEGQFLDIGILDHNEPVFVSGLGERPFHAFLQQYKGKSLASNIKVGSVQGKSTKNISNNIEIDGVSKATASVRIANKSILASALKVAREHLADIAPKPVSYPRKDLFEELDWQGLLDKGLVKHVTLLNKDVEKLYEGSDHAGEDDLAVSEPDEVYAEFWIADLGLPSVMRNLLSEENQKDLSNQLSPFEEPILVMTRGRHPLVTENFIRNTVPDRMGGLQNNFPVNVRDADLDVELQDGTPDVDQAMVLRIDTRLGFDPSSPWTFIFQTERKKNFFMSAVELRDITIDLNWPQAYFLIEKDEEPEGPLWLKSWQDQTSNLITIAVFLCLLTIVLVRPGLILGRLGIIRPLLLIFTLVFIGWYAQGQLSIVTVIAFFKALVEGQSLGFMLFDPVSLLIWGFVLITFFVWGRGTFCGWLCPYGVLQEISGLIAQKLKIKQIRLSDKINGVLTKVKYGLLLLSLGTGIFAAEISDKLVEIEPFKTAITLQFERDLAFVAYAAFWLIMGLFIFKGFCRFICPLGAFLALGGKVRLFDWLKRREECGSPCQLCNVRCGYQAIEKTDGAINYTECFQCFDCVDIMADEKQCVPLVLAARKQQKEAAQ